MSKRTLLALFALCFVFAAGCGPSLRHIKVQTVSEAESLQAEAAAKNLQCDDVTTADGFLARAKMSKSDREAADFADHAAAWYRVALARQSVDESAGNLKKAETALAASREQVERYQDILNRVNTNANTNTNVNAGGEE